MWFSQCKSETDWSKYVCNYEKIPHSNTIIYFSFLEKKVVVIPNIVHVQKHVYILLLWITKSIQPCLMCVYVHRPPLRLLPVFTLRVTKEGTCRWLPVKTWSVELRHIGLVRRKKKKGEGEIRWRVEENEERQEKPCFQFVPLSLISHSYDLIFKVIFISNLCSSLSPLFCSLFHLFFPLPNECYGLYVAVRHCFVLDSAGQKNEDFL